MDKTNGGAAFPRPIGQKINSIDGEHNWDQDGMSLRDYFAAKALQGLCANYEGNNKNHFVAPIDYFAEMSYKLADAMLKAREVDNA